MRVFAYVLISVLVLFAVLLIFFCIKSRRPLRTAAINAALGIAALAAVNLTARFTGVHIPLNVYTVPGAAIFGMPACAAFVVLEILMV